MFGELSVFGRTVEEKARYTLHIDFLLWLKYFNSLQNDLFSDDPEVRQRTRNCMVEYVSKIMTASYPDLEVNHNKSRDVNKAFPGKIISVSDQKIRNIRQIKNFLRPTERLPNAMYAISTLQQLRWFIFHLISKTQRYQVKIFITFIIQCQKEEVMFMQCYFHTKILIYQKNRTLLKRSTTEY